MPYRKERFRLRFHGLTEEENKNIKLALPTAALKERNNVLLFEIDQFVEMTPLYRVLDILQLGVGRFELLASVVTSSDNGGIELPQFALSVIRQTRCGVGFSFVSVGPDDEVEQDASPDQSLPTNDTVTRL